MMSVFLFMKVVMESQSILKATYMRSALLSHIYHTV